MTDTPVLQVLHYIAYITYEQINKQVYTLITVK